jgi:hypothetical protein
MAFQDIWLRFILASLFTWRITHLIALEDGPGDVIASIRTRVGNSFWGSLMDCFHCLSLWVAALSALLLTRSISEWPLAWLALSAMACLLERIGCKTSFTESVQEGAKSNVLRSEAGDS